MKIIKLSAIPLPKPAEEFQPNTLVIPEHDPDSNEPYPGNIQPGYYNAREIPKLLYHQRNNPEAILFIAEMADNDDPKTRPFARSIRNIASKPELIEQLCVSLLFDVELHNQNMWLN